jgi:hypothetical protein
MSRNSQVFTTLRFSALVAFLAITSFAIFGLSGCVNPPKSVTASAAATTVDPTDSTTLSATVKNDSDSKGVTWSLSGPGALSNQTSTSVTYTAPAATNAAQSATVTATSVADTSKSDPVNITIPAAVAVTTNALPGDIVGTAYSQQLAASGGIPPYTWSLVSGILPPCLSINSTGLISGTPIASCVGTATNLTFKVTDSGTATPLSATSAALSLNIAPAPAIQLPAPGPLAVGIVGSAYSASIAATGGAGTLTYSVSAGALPGGLTLTAAGAITGSPTAAGSFNFTVLAADAFGDSQSQSYSIKVNYPPVAINPAAGALPVALTGSAYAQSLTASGGSGAGFVWTVTGLPADGISAVANGATLAISGTPTTTANISFSASVKDGAGDVAGPFTYTIAVYNPISLPATNPASLPANATINAAYSGTITATGGSGSGYTWTVSGLSDGLTSSNSGGTLTISGTPTATGTVTFTAQVKDSSGSSAGPITYTITVNSVLTLPATNPATLPGNATTGTAYTGTITASGGSGTGYVFTVTGLPSNGISSSASGGTLTISGTPSTTGPINFSVTIKDSLGNTAGPIQYTITVYNPLALPASPNTLPASGPVNVAYTGTITVTGGSGSGYSFTVTGLSDGLTSAASGGTLTISGTPTSPSAVSFNVTVKDSVGNTIGPIAYTINIYAGLTLPSTNPSTLGTGIVASFYTGTITAVGGSGSGYVWTVTGLPSDGLNFTTNGATLTITGAPTSATTVTFNVTIKDSSNNSSGPITYTIPVYNPLSLPSPNPASLPSNAQTGTAYTGTIVAAGGSGSGYVFTVANLSDGLNYSSNGATLTISGTPTTPGTVTFNVSVKDSVNNSSGPLTYTINVNAPLSLPNPNPVTLPSATVNQVYQGSINGIGGVLPYTWTVNGATIANNGTAVPIANGQGLTVSASNSNMLSFAGTPNTIADVTFTVSVKDSLGNTAGPFTYNIQINSAGSQISGQINYYNYCGNNQTLPTFTVNLYTTLGNVLAATTTTDSNGNYSFPLVLNGNYTITPSITGPSSLFYPASQTISVDNANISGQNFNVELGYTVSGNVNYPGAQTGQVYLALSNNNCVGGNNSPGTSITAASLASGGAYSIRGVPPGTYTLTAWMDPLGFGQQNSEDPTGATSNISVSTTNPTGVNVTLTNAAAVTLPAGSGPVIRGVNPFAQGVVISYNALENSTGVETAASYTVQWATNATFTTGVGSTTFAATGTNGSNVWILNTNSVTGLTPGSTYYFRVQGVNGSSTSGWSLWGGNIAAPVTIAAPNGGVSVSGTVTFPGTATGPLYVGFYNANSSTAYVAVIGSKTSPPTSPAAYSVNVPAGAGYVNFAIIDQNNDGLVDAGDIQNVNGGGHQSTVTILSTGNPAFPVTLANGNSIATVSTQAQQSTSPSGTSTNYTVSFDVADQIKQPVAVAIVPPGTADIVFPVDIAACPSCGRGQFQFYENTEGYIPQVGDSYSLFITYSDGTSETKTVTVGALLTNAYPTLVAPAPDATGVSVTPGFSWTDPANAGNYTYQFTLWDSNYNQIWQIPGNNSNSNGFSSSTTSIPTFGTDPTGNGSKPTVPSLNPGETYNWQITVQDSNGNQAEAQASFLTAGTPSTLALPSNIPAGGALVGFPFAGSLAAFGGSGNGYVYEVNGAGPPVVLNNGISAQNMPGGLLISGTPTAATPVNFTVSVEDSANNSAGPVDYTVNVSNLPSGPNTSLLSGNYSCILSGDVDLDSSPWAALLNFTANGSAGTVTNGIFDSNGNNSTYFPTPVSGTLSGTFGVGNDFNGIATFNTSASMAGSTTSQWAIALAPNSSPATEFRLVEIDDVGTTPSGRRGTGDCFLTKPAAFTASNISGNSFVYELSGGSSEGGPKFTVGRWAGSNGNITSGVFDQAKNIPTVYTNSTLSAGSYTLPNSPNFATTGRYTAQLTEVSTFNYVIYMVDANRSLVLEIDSGKGTQAGRMQTQLQPSFSAANLNGPSVISVQGLGYANNTLSAAYSDVIQGVGSAGNYTYNQFFEDYNGNFSSNPTGTPYAVTFDPANPGRATSSPGTNAYYYLYDTNQGFVMHVSGAGTANGSADAGWIENQSQTSFSNSTVAGNYLLGQYPPLSAKGIALVGEVQVQANGTANASVSSAGLQEFEWDQVSNSLPYTFISNSDGSYSVSSGTSFFDCIGITPPPTGKTVCIESLEGAPAIAVFKQ